MEKLREDPVIVCVFGNGQVEIGFDIASIGPSKVSNFLTFVLGPRSVEAQEMGEAQFFSDSAFGFVSG